MNISSITINFIKFIILHNDIEKDSTIERIIEYVKNIQLKETEETLFKLLDMGKVSDLMMIKIN